MVIVQPGTTPPIPPVTSSTTTTTDSTSETVAQPDAFSDCPQPDADHQLCFWQNASYGGTFWDFNIYTGDGEYTKWSYIGSRYNDLASSLYNKRVDASYVARSWLPGPGVDQACIPPEAAFPNLTVYAWSQDGSNMNDSISALDLVSDNAC